MSEYFWEMQQNSAPGAYVVGPDTPIKARINKLLDECGFRSISQLEATFWTDKATPSIEEILEAIFKHAQIVIFLLTGEDTVCLRHDFDPRKACWQQPTQDRLFLAGYAFGLYRDRIFLVRSGQVRPLSDIAGRFIYDFDDPEYCNALRNRLKKEAAILMSDARKEEQDIVTKVDRASFEGDDNTTQDRRKVFVVFGRNTFILDEVRAFLRVIGLIPITWGDAVEYSGQGAAFTSEVLEVAFKQAWATVVLLTGDDLILSTGPMAYLQTAEKISPASQPRANVLFEAGMAFGERRLRKRTILLEFDFDRLQLIRNLSDRQRLRLNNSLHRREDFIRRLRILGCAVDLKGKPWHCKGNFYFAYKS
jgi:predicted nucleotide-binding protein